MQPNQLEREHKLSAKEFSEVFNTDISNCYRLLGNSCKKLMKTSVTLEKIELNEKYLDVVYGWYFMIHLTALLEIRNNKRVCGKSEKVTLS